MYLVDSEKDKVTNYDVTIKDYECKQQEYCNICEVLAPVSIMTVRGLCALSMFDR